MTSSTQGHDKFIMLNGLKFHYREWGISEAPPLILLHGFTAHARVWDTIAQALQDRYYVLALDQRGHGETEWAKDYSWSLMRDDIGTFAQALGYQKVSLLGSSMGGGNAFRYAGVSPQTVEQLVIVDVGPPLPQPPEPSSDVQDDAPWPDEFDGQEEMVQLVRSAFPYILESELATWVLYYARHLENGRWTWGYDAANFGDFTADPTYPTPEELWRLLVNITCPTLVVRGAESATFSREQAERMVHDMPNCRLIEIPDASHTVPWDKPDEFIAAVQGFLTRYSHQ
jgi:pimeloyl-ACP methyl ester carboxylesterase